MENFKSPVYNVIAVPIEKVVVNNYNPKRSGTSGNEIAGTFDMGRRLHDALRMLLPQGGRQI